jgi:hypothetical protein
MARVKRGMNAIDVTAMRTETRNIELSTTASGGTVYLGMNGSHRAVTMIAVTNVIGGIAPRMK